MAARGMKAPEIAKELGIKYNTVYYYLHPEKCSRKKTKAVKPDEKIATGWNADRHACKSCQYRAEKKGCDYYLITDKERGCDPADCDKYVEGKQDKQEKTNEGRKP